MSAGSSLLPALPGLAAVVTPRGHLRLVDDAGVVEYELKSRIRKEFDRGEGFGLLHLGAREIDAELPPSLAWWRDVAKLFVSGMCSLGEDAKASTLVVPLPLGEIGRLLGGVPPMPGAEYLSLSVVEELWAMIAAAAQLELRESELTLPQWLSAQHPSWNVVGRVVFHLAENKDSESKPFAFLATWTQRLGKSAAHHIALKAALKEYAGEKNRAALVRLLAPVVRASEKSELVRELLERGDLYHPLAWSIADAHRFLQEIPVLEEAGVVVRVGEWWKRAAAGPRIHIKLGDKVKGELASEKLVNFSADLTLDGERLTAGEVRRILDRTEGLALVRGRWIEVDRDRLSRLLVEFEAMQKLPPEITLADAMRFVAGATKLAEDREQVGAAPEWSDVVAGDWLAGVLGGMRGPEGLPAIAIPRGLNATLRGYQEAGLKWLWFLGSLGLGACLADDMGLGKTIQVLSLLLLRKERKEAQGPSLLVVPATLLANWESEAKRFAPSLSLVFAHPSLDADNSAATRALEADLVVTTYAYIRRADWLRERTWDVVILDEAQAIKNPGAQQTRSVKALKSRRRIALSGTPIENRLGDLWSIFDFLNPGLLGSAKRFGQFCKKLGDDFSPLRKLVSPYILRRLKSDPLIAPDLPAKTEVVAWCGLTKKQTVLYQQAVDQLKEYLENAKKHGMGRKGVILAYLTRFKQICNHPSHWLRDGQWDPLESGKAIRLAEIAEVIREKQEKALVFTQFQEMVAPLTAWLEPMLAGKGVVIHGGTSIAKRRDAVTSFQEDEEIRFLIATVKTGGAGLNLTAASHVIHFDRWWNPAVENQATDRSYRIGQKRNVLVHKLSVRGTIEEKIDRVISGKMKLSDDLLGGAAAQAITELSDADLLSLVSLDVNRVEIA